MLDRPPDREARIMASPPEAEDRPPGRRGPSFVALWGVVTVLWTISTVLRINRTWVPVMGWHAVIGSVYTWISLFLPPWMFAIVMLALKRLASGRQGAKG
jgi:hypothetical protein